MSTSKSFAIPLDVLSNGPVVDLRSDTITKPTEMMREVMARAPVGDDVYGEDPSCNALEGRVAEILGKEAALYVSSGTMGNLIAAMVYAQQPFAEIILGKYSHVARSEAGGISTIAHASTYQITNNEDGTLPLDELEHAVTRIEDQHYAIPRVVFLENTFGHSGGKVLPQSFVLDAKSICQRRTSSKVALHCDGARLWNAAVAQGISFAEAAAPYDSVQCCLSKGLGAPVGSVLAGPADFIARARHVRKMLGGGMRQAGIIAAAGLYAVDNHLQRLHEDHAHATLLANMLREAIARRKPFCEAQDSIALVKEQSEIDSKVSNTEATSRFRLNVHTPQSNMCIVDLPSASVRNDLVSLCAQQNILVCRFNTHSIRMIPNINTNKASIERAAMVIIDVLSDIIKC